MWNVARMTLISRHEPTARASKFVTHNGVVYLSGQIAEDPDAAEVQSCWFHGWSPSKTWRSNSCDNSSKTRIPLTLLPCSSSLGE
jgi:hypothetical protein